MTLRLIFMGTPDFAVPTLAKIIDCGHEVAAVYTRAPQPAGRGLELRPSAVEREARRFGVAVLTPKTLRTQDAQETFREHRADAVVVVAYGLILPKAILDAPRLGCLNLHASELPRWRGAAPINRAIMAGDTKTAVMVMRMEEGLDTGSIARTRHAVIGPDMTAGELHDALAHKGAAMMALAVGSLERSSLRFKRQSDKGVTYAAKFDKSETRIDWTRPWQAVHDHCRGLSPFPGAWFDLPEGGGARVKVLHTTKGEGSGAPGVVIDNKLTVACGDGAVRILELQRAGRQPMPSAEFLRGTSVPGGSRLE